MIYYFLLSWRQAYGREGCVKDWVGIREGCAMGEGGGGKNPNTAQYKDDFFCDIKYDYSTKQPGLDCQYRGLINFDQNNLS